MSDFSNFREVTGRQPYCCDLCGYRIRRGATHLYVSGVFDGVFACGRRHLVCNAATDGWITDDWDMFCGFNEFRTRELKLPLIDMDRVP
jgi:hypothetical protein